MKLKKQIDSLESYLLGLFLVVIVINILISIAGRTFWPHSLRWPGEVACVMLLYLTFIGAIGLFRRGDHIMLSYLVAKLSSRGRQFLAIVHNLTAGVVFVIILVYGVSLWLRFSYKVTDAARIPYIFFLLPHMVCSASIVVFSFVKLWSTFKMMLRR